MGRLGGAGHIPSKPITSAERREMNHDKAIDQLMRKRVYAPTMSYPKPASNTDFFPRTELLDAGTLYIIDRHSALNKTTCRYDVKGVVTLYTSKEHYNFMHGLKDSNGTRHPLEGEEVERWYADGFTGRTIVGADGLSRLHPTTEVRIGDYTYAFHIQYLSHKDYQAAMKQKFGRTPVTYFDKYSTPSTGPVGSMPGGTPEVAASAPGAGDSTGACIVAAGELPTATLVNPDRYREAPAPKYATSASFAGPFHNAAANISTTSTFDVDSGAAGAGYGFEEVDL